MPKPQIVFLKLEIHSESERSWFVFDGKRYCYLPRSRCRYNPETSTFAVPRWLAEREQLI